MITVTIASVDRTSSVVFNSLKKTDNLNQQVDNLTFSINKYGSLTYKPDLGDEVVVTNGATTVFGGVIVKIEEKTEASKIIEYNVTCNDYSQYLKRKLVTERYVNTTLFTVIADMIDAYASDFTYVNIAGDVPIESFAFNRLTVADSLQKLADALSYVWYVDYDKDIHFFPKNTETAPFDLTDTSGNYIFNSLQIVEDLTQIRNSILVQGGEAESSLPRTEYFSGDNQRVQFALANKFASLPTVLVGTETQTVGVEFLGDDASFDCMWNFNEKYIRFTSGNVPGTGDNNISVEGIYLFPIVVRIPAPASISEYGYYEFAITDKSIGSQDEAIERALAELKSYQNELYDGRFRTYTDGLRSGMVININSTQRGKDIDVLIQSVSTRMRDPNGSYFEYDVSFATLKSVGIIEYLQRQLRDKEIVNDDQETLLNYLPLDSDEVGFSDALGTATTSSPPYVWSNDAGTTPDKLVWDYGTWQ